MALATVRLLDIEPDLGRYLTAADVELLDGLPVPVVEIAPGDVDVMALLVANHAFGACVIGGLLMRSLAVGNTVSFRLLGPGDLIGPSLGQQSVVVSGGGWRAGAPTQIALLDRSVLIAAHRAPRLSAGLHARSADQADRVAVQLGICQLPRVEDRVLAMLWHLAESWGQVTSRGTALRLHLTHEMIGGLVGARRSTVTLALGQLAEAGAIVRHERGWVLLEPPPAGQAPASPRAAPELLGELPAAAPDEPAAGEG